MTRSSSELLLTAALTAGLVVGGKVLVDKVTSSSSSDSSPTSEVEEKKDGKNLAQWDPVFEEEFLSRVSSFFGTQGLEMLRDSYVIVVGLGGVGSHCASMLARSGVGRLRLIDFDQVSMSSLNRHAVATFADVGKPKVETMARRLKEIVPFTVIDPVAQMFVAEAADELLGGHYPPTGRPNPFATATTKKDEYMESIPPLGEGFNRRPDLVIDAIDDVNTKAQLLAYCYHHNLPVLTSMGAGGKSDPTRMRIAPLTDCICDPLSQKIRWKLKKAGVPADAFTAVFSIEKPVVELLPLNEEQRNAPQDFGTVDYLRLRVIPVLGTSPSVFGQALAAYALCGLGGKPFDPETGERVSKNLRHKVRQVFKKNEVLRFGSEEAINMDEDDIEFILQQVWHCRCAVSKKRFGGQLVMTLTRWNADLPPTPYNVVLMAQNVEEAFRAGGKESLDPDIVASIEGRLAWARQVCTDSWTGVDSAKHDRQMAEIIAYETTKYDAAKAIALGEVVLKQNGTEKNGSPQNGVGYVIGIVTGALAAVVATNAFR